MIREYLGRATGLGDRRLRPLGLVAALIGCGCQAPPPPLAPLESPTVTLSIPKQQYKTQEPIPFEGVVTVGEGQWVPNMMMIEASVPDREHEIHGSVPATPTAGAKPGEYRFTGELRASVKPGRYLLRAIASRSQPVEAEEQGQASGPSESMLTKKQPSEPIEIQVQSR